MVTPKEQEFTEAIDTTETDQQLQIPTELPVLPLRDIVIYPFMIVPLFVSRETAVAELDPGAAQSAVIGPGRTKGVAAAIRRRPTT